MAVPTAIEIQQLLNGPEFVPLATENGDLMITETGDFIIVRRNVKYSGNFPHGKNRNWLRGPVKWVKEYLK